MSPIPDDGWITVRDHDYESLTEAERKIHDISGGGSLPAMDDPRSDEYDASMAAIANATGLMYERPDCGIIMWQKPRSDVFQPYSPIADVA